MTREPSTKEPGLQSRLLHQTYDTVVRDHQPHVGLAIVPDPPTRATDQVVILNDGTVPSSGGARKAHDRRRESLVGDQMQGPGPEVGRIDPWLHDGDSTRSEVSAHVRQRRSQVVLVPQMPHRAEQAAYHVEAGPEAKRPHVRPHEPDTGQSLPGDPEHFCASVDPDTGVVATEVVEMAARPAADVQPSCRTVRPVPSRDPFELPNLAPIVLPLVEGVIVGREAMVEGEPRAGQRGTFPDRLSWAGYRQRELPGSGVRVASPVRPRSVEVPYRAEPGMPPAAHPTGNPSKKPHHASSESRSPRSASLPAVALERKYP